MSVPRLQRQVCEGPDADFVEESYPLSPMQEGMLFMLREFQPQGPYLLGGHCNGGLIAFEMARQLADRGERGDLLALICTTRDNARFRALHRLLNLYYCLRGLDESERQERFLLNKA